MSLEGKMLYGTSGRMLAIKLVGELRFNMADALTNALKSIKSEMQDHEVTIDLSGLNYADSMILGIIISFLVQNTAEKSMSNQQANLVCMNSDFKRILESMGLNQYFNLVDQSYYKNNINSFQEITLTQ